MNICAGGATGLSGAKAALVGKRSVARAKAWATGVSGAGTKADNAAAPCQEARAVPCFLFLDISFALAIHFAGKEVSAAD